MVWVDPSAIIYGAHYGLWGWCPPEWILYCIMARVRMKPTKKKIVSFETCNSLLALCRMGKVRVIKEYDRDEVVLSVVSASGSMIGVVGERYKYLFENEIVERGSGDGLLEGCSQTTRVEP